MGLDSTKKSRGITMNRTLTKKQIEDYQKLCSDRTNGRLLTPEGLYFICEACNFDAETIGKHFLEILPQIYHKGN